MTYTETLEPAEQTIKALHLHKISVVRLQDELDALIKIFSHLRESFENEMMSGLGYKKLGVPPGLMKQGQELTKMMTDVVAAKIRFDKAAKAMADNMTPDEERLACQKYVRSLPPDLRRIWVDELYAWMRKQNESFATISANQAKQ